MIKKIYFVRLNNTKFGGAENYLRRLSKALSKNNYDHELINSIFPGFLPSWLKVILFNLQVLLLKKGRFYYSLDRIVCPDIYRAGDGVHKAFLISEDKSRLNPLHSIYLYLERSCFVNAKSIIANSKMVKQQIIDHYNIDPSKINIIYNGIEFNEVNYEKSFVKLSKEFHLKKEQSVILFVGSGFKRKGVKEFLEIFSQLKSQNTRAFIVGKDKSLKSYITIAKELGIDKRVTFTGQRLDVNDFYTISDILLFPTHYDPFSNVVLEAMSFGTVIFTTKSNGASEILSPSFIMKTPHDEEIIGSIDKLLMNKNELKKHKLDNLKLSKSFSIEKNLTQTLEVINQIEKTN